MSERMYSKEDIIALLKYIYKRDMLLQEDGTFIDLIEQDNCCKLLEKKVTVDDIFEEFSTFKW
jgi:hypothetical protein